MSGERRQKIYSLRRDIQKLREIIEGLEFEERRECQLEKLAVDPTRLSVEFGARLGEYCVDLAYHAKRTGRTILGSFNDIPLEATPSTDADELHRQYTQGCERKSGA